MTRIGGRGVGPEGSSVVESPKFRSKEGMGRDAPSPSFCEMLFEDLKFVKGAGHSDSTAAPRGGVKKPESFLDGVCGGESRGDLWSGIDSAGAGGGEVDEEVAMCLVARKVWAAPEGVTLIACALIGDSDPAKFASILF